jgi:signal transduction histidine kinase
VLLTALLLVSSQTLAGRAEVIIRDGVTGTSTTKETNVVTVPKDAAGFADMPSTQIKDLAAQLRDGAVGQLLLASALALAIMTVFATAVGWWVSGRVLRPLHTVTSQARSLSWHNIHERIGMTGPRDELRELADTFDDMLDRLDRAFSGQRRFIANAAHELRTPLAVERATIQVRLADAEPEELPAIREELLAINRRFERLIDGLLTLAGSEHGLSRSGPVDLGALARSAAADSLAAPPLGTPPNLAVSVDTAPVHVLGDDVLLTQLAANLIQNAMRYNVPGGWVEVRTSTEDGLVVRNHGPVLDPDEIDTLFEPFRRGESARARSPEGAGLGLSIVRAIATAHHGTVDAVPEPGGGLRVTVTLPRAAVPDTADA